MTGTSAFSPRRISTRLRSQRRTGVSAQRTVDVVEDATHATAVGDVHFSVGEMQLFEDLTLITFPVWRPELDAG